MTQELRNLVHVENIPIRWGDMDALSHVNNTIFFRYMEIARINWLDKMGVHIDSTTEVGPIIMTAACTFLKQLTYPGNLTIKMYLGQPGRSSIMTYYDMCKEGEETLYAEASAKIVWANYALGKSCPLPEEMRKLATPTSTAALSK